MLSRLSNLDVGQQLTSDICQDSARRAWCCDHSSTPPFSTMQNEERDSNLQHPRKQFCPRAFRCNQCRKTCKTIYGLRQHKDAKHAIPDAMKYPPPRISSGPSDSPASPPALHSSALSSPVSQTHAPHGSTPSLQGQDPAVIIERHPLLDGA